MIKVRIKKSLAGDWKGESFKYGKGAVVVLDDQLANDFINSGLAEPYEDGPPKNPIVKTTVIKGSNSQKRSGKK